MLILHFCFLPVLLPAVISWFTFAFAVVATLVSFLALRRSRHLQAAPPYPASAYTNDSERDTSGEKEREKDVEIVGNGKSVPEA